MAGLIERATLALAALDETDALEPASREIAKAAQLAGMKRRKLEVADLDARIGMAAARDLAAARRPAGCFCLGLGGLGVLVVVRGRRVWERPCGCPEALALLAEAERAREAADREERARRAEEERVAAARELMRRLAFAGLPPRVVHGFEDFGAERAKSGAVARMRAFADPRPQRGVLLWGGFGTGKTTLLAAAVRAWVGAGGAAVFCTLADYLESLRPQDGRTPPLGAERVSRARSIGLLALDDLGAERLTQWGRDAVFRLVNARYDAGLPTIATSNYSLDDLVGRFAGDDDPREGQRIVERLAETCDVIELVGRNYRRPAAE